MSNGHIKVKSAQSREGIERAWASGRFTTAPPHKTMLMEKRERGNRPSQVAI